MARVKNGENPNLYFLHIPKTAGTSFSSFLENYFREDEIFAGHLLPDLFEEEKERLSKYKLFRGHFWGGLSTYVGHDLKTLTMLRDPVECTISYFAHVQRDPGSYRHKKVVSENWSVLDFVMDEETNWDIVNTETLFLAVDLDYSQLKADPEGYGRRVVKEYAQRGNDREILALAKERLESMAFVGITERMKESIELLCYQESWQPPMSDLRQNVSPLRPITQDLSVETIDAIKRLNGLDIELYEFGKELFEERYRAMLEDCSRASFKPKKRLVPRKEQHPLSKDDRGLFRIKINSSPREVSLSERFDVSVEIRNYSDNNISSSGPNSIHISYHWIDRADHMVVIFEGERTSLSLLAFSKEEIQATIIAPDNPGSFILKITLVQEGVAWFDDQEPSVFSACKITVS